MVNQWDAYDKERANICLQGIKAHVRWQMEYERKQLAMWKGLLKQLLGDGEVAPQPTSSATSTTTS